MLRKKYKITAVYWVSADVPALLRSSVTSIIFAVLCRAEDVTSFGYSSVLYCLRILWVWKSVLNVVADNCAVPPIAWLIKSFSSSFVWVRSHSFRWKKWRRGHFSSRERHEMHVHTVQENTSLTHVESRGSAHLQRIKIISMFCQVTLLMCCTICLRV